MPPDVRKVFDLPKTRFFIMGLCPSRFVFSKDRFAMIARLPSIMCGPKREGHSPGK